MSFAAMQMHKEMIILSEVSQKKEDKYHIMSHLCGIKYMTQMNLFTRQKHTLREQTSGCQGRQGGLRVELGIKRYKLFYIYKIMEIYI